MVWNKRPNIVSHRHVAKFKTLGGQVVMRRAAAARRRLLICPPACNMPESKYKAGYIFHEIADAENYECFFKNNFKPL